MLRISGMKRKTSLFKNQSGIISFFVVTIVMVVLSLIVLTFSQLARREQRQSLDRQLSTQAFYAAESGVNDAVNAMNTDDTLFSGGWNDNCDGPNSFADRAGLNNNLGNGAFYSCILVDVSPPELNYSSVPTDESVAASIRADGGASIQVLEISWDDFDGQTTVTGCPSASTTNSFPGSLSAGCRVGALRLELVPFNGPTSQDQLINNRFIGFAQPRGGGVSTINFNTGQGDNQGVKTTGGCSSANTPRFCMLRISGLSGNQYYLRMRSIYRPTAVTIKAYTGSASPANRVDLIGSQAEIDVTGRANEVLRRIKVAAPLSTEGISTPEFALQSSDTLCKRFSLAPAAASGGSAFLDWESSRPGTGSGECDPTE